MAGHLLQFLCPRAPVPTGDPGSGTRRLTFLGTAGFVLEAPGRTLVLDPYLSRPGLFRTAFARLASDEDLLRRVIPHADDVLCGHSHHDHALDAPALCRLTGARLIGSSATLHMGRAAGLPESQMVLAGPMQGDAGARFPAIRCGDALATPIPSLHGKALFGRVPLPGDIVAPPPWPPRVYELRHGQVLLWLVDVAGVRVLHVDSAEFLVDDVRAAVGDEGVDVLCLCAVGRQYRKDYTREIVAITRPKVVVPCHWDDFTLPYYTPPRQLPGVDVDAFCAEIRAAGSSAVVLGFGQSWAF